MLVAAPPNLRDTSRALSLARKAVDLADQGFLLPLMRWATTFHADGLGKTALPAQKQALSMVPQNSMRAHEIMQLLSEASGP